MSLRGLILGLPRRLLVGAGRILAGNWKPLLAGAVVALLARAYVLDIYGVRKHSMEPTLHAEEGGADRVAVFKLAWLLSAPERWDLCVYRRQGQGHNVVKRVVGLPGEYIRIGREGDLYVGANPARLALLRKTPEQLASLLVPIARLDVKSPGSTAGAVWEYAADRWRAGPEGLTGTPVDGVKPLRFDYGEIPHRGYIEPDGLVRYSGQEVRDFGLDLTLRPLDPAARVRLELTSWNREYRLRLSAEGVEIRADGTRLLRLEPPEGWGERSLRVRFVQADRRLFLWLDDRAWVRDLGPWPELPAGLKVASRRNRTGLEIAGGRVRLERLQVVRDLHFNGTTGTHGTGGVPAALGQGEYFMLGDNSGVSEDSRHYGAVSESWLIGRPVLVVLPLTRCKWL